MKRLLFTLLFSLGLLLTANAQNAILKSDSVSAWVTNTQGIVTQNAYGTFYALWTDSTLSLVRNDGTILQSSRKYSGYSNVSGTPFASMASLKAWVKTYFFVDASASGSGGGGSTPVVVVTSDSLTVSSSGTYTFTGSVTKQWVMPTVANATGMVMFIMNRGGASLTVNSNSGGSDFDINSVYSNTINIAPGENWVIRGNSIKLVSINQ